MAEWLVEEGIGEHRAVLVEHGEIVAARIDWLDPIKPGLIADGELTERIAGSRRGTARIGYREVLVDGLPRDASEGASLRLEVTRAAIDERLRSKSPRTRPTDRAIRTAPSLATELGARIVRHIEGWEELWFEAAMPALDFVGGSITVESAAALTAIDIDGTLPPRALALAAVPTIAHAIRRFDLAGSIVIDFPTLEAKADRHAVDAALATALADWPHEATAMNGFGLVQLVARRTRPSLLELFRRWQEVTARQLMRRAERVQEPGALLLTTRSEVKSVVRPEMEEELARRTGRQIRWRIDDALPKWACVAQAVPL